MHPISPCHVVALPYPGRGHINPMLNLCTAVADKTQNILITMVVTEEWLDLIRSTTKPQNICFTSIPNILPSEQVRGNNPRGFWEAVRTKMEEPIDRVLDQLPLQPDFIIADPFLTWATDLAARRDVPLASLWPMSASVFTVFYHFHLLLQNAHFPINLSVNGDEIVDYIPGLPPIHVLDLHVAIRDEKYALTVVQVIPKSKFLIFTSINGLEFQTIDALRQNSTYSIYNIGPFSSYSKLKSKTIRSQDEDHNIEYIKWLDLQSYSSVLYISLGSYLSVSESQMHEIAAGLRESGLHFLWVARGEIIKLQEMCGEKCLVVSWCDQLSVLSHSSVGGFWTHCGWNSTKEAVMAGVPMLTFPIVMDQVTNAKLIVEDWRVGWRVKREFDKEDLVTRDEIKELVLRFMDLESEERKGLSTNARNLQMVSKKEFENREFEENVDAFIKSFLKC